MALYLTESSWARKKAQTGSLSHLIGWVFIPGPFPPFPMISLGMHGLGGCAVSFVLPCLEFPNVSTPGVPVLVLVVGGEQSHAPRACYPLASCVEPMEVAKTA